MGCSAPYVQPPAAITQMEPMAESILLSRVAISPSFQVGEEDRGYLLELLLTKLRYITAEGGDVDWEDAPPHFVRDGLQVGPGCFVVCKAKPLSASSFRPGKGDAYCF